MPGLRRSDRSSAHGTALSRKDNKTTICSDCGTIEALMGSGMSLSAAKRALIDAKRFGPRGTRRTDG